MLHEIVMFLKLLCLLRAKINSHFCLEFQAIGNEKSSVREAVMDVMEAKLKAQFAQQQQAGASK